MTAEEMAGILERARELSEKAIGPPKDEEDRVRRRLDLVENVIGWEPLFDLLKALP